MAADLTRAVITAGGMACAGLAFCGLTFSGLVRAAPPLPDPTRPPLLAAPAAEAPARGAGGGRAAVPAPTPPAAQVLQSLQLGPGHASALVDGRLLRVGDRLGPRTVVGIDAQGLTLRTEAGRTERLELLGGVVKHAVGAAPATASVQARLQGAATALPSDTASSASAGRTSP